MASKALWISVWMVALSCLVMSDSGIVWLSEGQQCGRYITGKCVSGLKCLPDSSVDEDSYAGGICVKPPGCNCSEVQCPPHRRGDCSHGRVTDPCGCCSHCARQKGQVCGGPSWRWGYCDDGLPCVHIAGHELALPPQMGVCKELPGHKSDRYNDPLCPWEWGCSIRVGNCDCYSEQSCHLMFSYGSYEACRKVWEADMMYFSSKDLPDKDAEEEPQPRYTCKEWRCEVQDCQCVCQMSPCEYQRPLMQEKECCSVLKEAGCPNMICFDNPAPPCPPDSFTTEPYTEPSQCCPTVPPMCTCDFKSCPRKHKICSEGEQPKLVAKAEGRPGSCCDCYECVKNEI
ncbi:cysteine-rich motor neuron 1 protein-like [Trichomycterus rosablanca]|uniref:cysteine-rich motor neuron 1 protein-like n=1 Tax=Trichomycterus rosablanca TaxID=2290929 RepID=UPI002F356116